MGNMTFPNQVHHLICMILFELTSVKWILFRGQGLPQGLQGTLILHLSLCTLGDTLCSRKV